MLIEAVPLLVPNQVHTLHENVNSHCIRNLVNSFGLCEGAVVIAGFAPWTLA